MITELDIFAQNYRQTTVGITGTLGKTSITTLLQQHIPNSIAAGNIGYPMLNILALQQPPSTTILELSSFQLNYIRNFAPDIAIWTNFYPNHLDHHTSEDEYFLAKCNIMRHQTSSQIALIACNLIERIKKCISINSQIFLFCTQQCSKHTYPTFTNSNNQIKCKNNVIFDNTNRLPNTTFEENWLIIIATLYILKAPLIITNNHNTLQEHRLEKIGTYKNSTFYNDSKSTVWQATKQAIASLNQESCALFLGGLSKGTDRTPLIQYLQNKPITVFAFGKEAETLQTMCQKYNISCSAYTTLDEAFIACMKQPLPKNILLSPSGASFDLFKNYIERGNHFKSLYNQLAHS